MAGGVERIFEIQVAHFDRVFLAHYGGHIVRE